MAIEATANEIRIYVNAFLSVFESKWHKHTLRAALTEARRRSCNGRATATNHSFT